MPERVEGERETAEEREGRRRWVAENSEGREVRRLWRERGEMKMS